MIVLIILNGRNFRIYSQNKVNKKITLKYYWTEPFFMIYFTIRHCNIISCFLVYAWIIAFTSQFSSYKKK